MVPSRRSVLFSKPDKSTYSYSQNHIHFIECVGWISMSKAKFRKIMLLEIRYPELRLGKDFIYRPRLSACLF